MRRIAITTPNVMAALRRLNRDQARPYNFALSPVIVNLSDTPVTLLGPFENNSARWREMPYINMRDGKTHTLNPPTIPVIAQTFETVLSQYVRHPEYKSLAPDGKPCKADSYGLLRRYPVTVTEFNLIGKETERGWEQAHKYIVAVVEAIRAKRWESERILTRMFAEDVPQRVTDKKGG
jgi:hypothetical protein